MLAVVAWWLRKQTFVPESCISSSSIWWQLVWTGGSWYPVFGTAADWLQLHWQQETPFEVEWEKRSICVFEGNIYIYISNVLMYLNSRDTV